MRILLVIFFFFFSISIYRVRSMHSLLTVSLSLSAWKVTIFGEFPACISRVRTEHCDLQYEYPYSVRMRENTEEKNLQFRLFLRFVCLYELSLSSRQKVNDIKHVFSLSKFFINISFFFIIWLNSHLDQIFVNLISYRSLIHSSKKSDSFMMHDVLEKKGNWCYCYCSDVMIGKIKGAF